MRVLAFDTATALTAVALCDIPGPLELERVDDPPAGARPGHASRLLTLIGELLEEGDTGWAEIDRIAVGVGPGTFTGLRIGIATAQALAASARQPLVGISTLRSLALGAQDQEMARLAVIDARRGEVFAAGWAADQDPRTAGPALAPRVLAPEQLARLVAASGADTVAIGDGALKFADLLEAAGAILPAPDSPLHRVSARHHCQIAPLVSPSAGNAVEPEYLRVADAELSG
jgi:tRNA threonylcarbamoyladenosine biosynthesis protein TsaB